MSTSTFASRMLVAVSAQDTWLLLAAKGGIESVAQEAGEAAAVALEGYKPLAIGLHVVDFDLAMFTRETWTDVGREYDCDYEARHFRHRRPTAKELKLLHGPGDPVKSLRRLWSDILCWSDALAALEGRRLKAKQPETLYARYLKAFV